MIPYSNGHPPKQETYRVGSKLFKVERRDGRNKSVKRETKLPKQASFIDRYWVLRYPNHRLIIEFSLEDRKGIWVLVPCNVDFVVILVSR